MADNQVALSRMTRGTSSSLSKATRQAVPPFLQKLYEMVSDSATDNLIRWSENGDSFFVLDHERVAHDVLPRWFKHSNFASFVRQLNMYGFHKIPHLQQGVLKSESETEIWNFEHSNFRRGQPDMLCLITRKRQAPERQSEDMSLGEKDSGAQGLVGGLTPGSLVDINSIINGIAAIKRHQATISTDLNDLKSSNQHLWQEALDARERHQKQQDTINRILKFLAGVFGSAGAHNGSPVHGSPHASIPRKRQRLMIEGAAQSVKDNKPLEPLDGVEPMVETATEQGSPTNRFIEVSPSLAPSKAPSVVPDTPDMQNPNTQFQSQPPLTADIVMGGNFAIQQPFLPFSNTTTLPPNGGDNSIYPPRPSDSSAPGALTSSSPGPREELLQSIINSPGSMQRLLNLLNFQQQQQNIPMPPPLDLNDSKADSGGYMDIAFDPYTQQPYSTQPNSDPTTLSIPKNFDLVEPDSQTMSLLHSGDDTLPGCGGISAAFEPYIENAHRLKKTSDAAEVITEHVNLIDSNIENLIKQMGLDHTQLESMRDEEFGMHPSAGVDVGVGVGVGGAEGELFNHDQNEQQNSDSSTGVNTNASTESSTGTNTNTNTSNSNSTNGPNAVSFQPTLPDFDFTVFLNELAKHHGDADTSGSEFADYKPDNLDAVIIDSNTNANANANVNMNNTTNHKLPTESPQLSAFVDEIASQSGQSDVSSSVSVSQSSPRMRAVVPDESTASPNALTTSLPDIANNKKAGTVGTVLTSTSTRKRKPDVVDPPTPTSNTRSQTKTKRKR